jgi:hypothetical protein
MGILLKNEDLRNVFEKLNKNINDEAVVMELIELLRPILKETVRKFHINIPDDIMQELIIALIKKKEYLTKAFISGEIKNMVHYLFTTFRNAALAAIQKERKHTEHLMPLDDVKLEAITCKRNYTKTRAFLKVRQETFEWLKYRFPKEKDFKRSCKFVDLILSGKKVSFLGTKPNIKALNIKIVKDVYSIVLNKIRELIIKYSDEFGYKSDEQESD